MGFLGFVKLLNFNSYYATPCFVSPLLAPRVGCVIKHKLHEVARFWDLCEYEFMFVTDKYNYDEEKMKSQTLFSKKVIFFANILL